MKIPASHGLDDCKVFCKAPDGEFVPVNFPSEEYMGDWVIPQLGSTMKYQAYEGFNYGLHQFVKVNSTWSPTGEGISPTSSSLSIALSLLGLNP